MYAFNKDCHDSRHTDIDQVLDVLHCLFFVVVKTELVRHLINVHQKHVYTIHTIKTVVIPLLKIILKYMYNNNIIELGRTRIDGIISVN